MIIYMNYVFLHNNLFLNVLIFVFVYNIIILYIYIYIYNYFRLEHIDYNCNYLFI